jgi:hypothetical protein
MTTPKGTTQGLEELRQGLVDGQMKLAEGLYFEGTTPEWELESATKWANEMMLSIEVELTKARKSELSALVNHTYLNHDSSGSAIEVLKCVKERLDTLNTQLESHKQKGNKDE